MQGKVFLCFVFSCGDPAAILAAGIKPALPSFQRSIVLFRQISSADTADHLFESPPPRSTWDSLGREFANFHLYLPTKFSRAHPFQSEELPVEV